MLAQPSLLSLVAAGLYLIVLTGCLVAKKFAQQRQLPSWHSKVWLALVVLFASLMLMRFLNLEDVFRGEIREIAKAFSIYEQRRLWQAIFLVMIASIGLLVMAFVARRMLTSVQSRADRIVIVALSAGIGMLVLIGLRLISLHSIDVLLYDFKINWAGDLGLSLLVCGSALIYSSKGIRETGPNRKINNRQKR